MEKVFFVLSILVWQTDRVSLVSVDYCPPSPLSVKFKYAQRSRELRIEDRGRRMLLNRFIAQNVDGLFDVGRSRNRSNSTSAIVPATAEEGEGSEVTSSVPPIETFMRVGREDRTRHFFDTIAEGDVLFAKVCAFKYTI